MADRIEQQINSATKAIEKLNKQIANLKSELAGGGLGTDQFKQMERQIKSLGLALEKQAQKLSVAQQEQQRKKIELVNEQQLQRAAKAIETTRRQLQYLRSEAASRSAGNKPFLDFSPEQLEKEIGKYERALKSFQSRVENLQRNKRYGLSGAISTPTPEPTNLEIFQRIGIAEERPPREQVERNLNRRLHGLPLTNAELKAKIAEARRIALDVQQGLIETRFGGGRASGGFGGGWTGRARYTAAEDPLPGNQGDDFGFESEKDKAKKEKERQRKQRADERASKAAEREAAAREKAAQAAEFHAQMVNRVTNNPRYREALEQAGRLGLGVGDLKSIENRGGGIERLLFQSKQGGVNTKFNTFVNQYGGATPGLSSQFRSFGRDIARDIGQFTKWSIAVAAVYTPLQKLSELIGIMVENESRLADATIAANVPFEKAGEIFDRSAEAANRAGEAITGVIDAYAQAIRAAGRYADEAERSQQATALLNDSLILSKLSALDQATAIDTLSAALLQSDLELDQGQSLLNKWVRVSQIANVSIDSLATGVAVLGDSAETTGLSIDELNGLIAVLAEQSISGSKEAANTAKALIGAYQSDKAEAALNKYGIALRKANGEVRDFLDVYRDLAKLREQGVLSEASISELALALGGGGVRRAKDASALINSQDRLNQVAEESRDIAEGSTLAQDSLAKKLETVETANTRLANSFQELAQTLGDEGGILDHFKTMLNLLTAITQGADSLFSVMGRSGPILVSVLASMVALRSLSGGKRETMLAQLGVEAGTTFGRPRTLEGRYPGYGRGLAGDLLQFNYRGAGVLAGAGVAAAGIQNLSQGKDAEALANVVGGIIGAAIGVTLGGPIGLAAGATIGSSAAESLITAVTDYAPTWQKLFAPPETVNPPEDKTPEGTQQQLLDRLTSESTVNQVVARSISSVIRNLPDFLTRNFPGSEQYRKQLSAEQIQLYYSPQKLQNQIREEENRRNVRAGGFTPEEEVNYEGLRKQLERQATAERERQLQRLAQGDITPANYGRISEQLTGFPSTAIQSVGAYGEEFKKLNGEIDSTAEAYDAFLYISTNGTEEQIAELSKYSTDIRTLDNLIKTLKPEDIGLELELSFGNITVKSREQLQALMRGIKEDAANVANRTLLNVQLSQNKLPPIAGSYTEATTQTDQNLIVQEALRIQEKYLKESGKYTEEQISELIKQIEPFSVYVNDAGRMFYDTIEGLNQWAYDAARKSLEELGKINKEEKGIGFQQYDVPISTLEQLATQSLMIGQNWQQRFNYDYKPEDQIAIDQQGIVQPLHADFKILALLLEKIVDQNQKQLDGQYNIPEGATFWVPLTAAYYRRGPDDGAGGMQSLLDSLAVDTNTSATDQNTQALRDLTAKYQTGEHLRREYASDLGIGPKASTRHENRYDFMNQRSEVGTRVPVRNPNEDRYDKMNATTTQTSALQQFLQELKNGITNLFTNPLQSLRDVNTKPGGGTVGGRFQQNNAPVAPTAKLDLKISSSINLMVDGRVLASTLQNYFASELLRTEQSQGTITKRYVI